MPQKKPWCRVLVTGGAGFIGGHLVAALQDHAESVCVLDDLSTGLLDNLTETDAEFVEASITDPDALHKAMKGVEVCFHLAALPSVSRSVENPLRTHAINATGTLNVLDACRTANVSRVVISSSSSVYGLAQTYPTGEDALLQPRSPYAASKAAAEGYGLAYRESFDMQVVALRYFNVFGPRQDPESAYAAVIPKFITKMLRGETIEIHGDGQQARDFTYVDNIVDANIAAARIDAPASFAYNIACGASSTLLSLVEHLEAILDMQADRKNAPARVGDIRRSWASIDRARTELGYASRVDLEAGLRETAAWYRGKTVS